MVCRRERRGGGRVFGGGGVELGGFGVGELVRSRLTDEGSGFGEIERFFGDLVSFWVGPCLVSLGESWLVGVSLDDSSMAGGSAFTDVFSCFSNGDRGSGSGIVGMGKSL